MNQMAKMMPNDSGDYADDNDADIMLLTMTVIM